MGSANQNGWRRQLAAMYQGLLFLEGHIVEPGVAGGEGGGCRVQAPAGAAARHPAGAASRLAARRLRAGTTLSLFR